MGASRGGFGTVRAQMHLRQVCVFLDLKPLNRPELMVSQAARAFDAAGRLLDDGVRDRLRELLAALVTWTDVLRLVPMGWATP